MVEAAGGPPAASTISELNLATSTARPAKPIAAPPAAGTDTHKGVDAVQVLLQENNSLREALKALASGSREIDGGDVGEGRVGGRGEEEEVPPGAVGPGIEARMQGGDAGRSVVDSDLVAGESGRGDVSVGSAGGGSSSTGANSSGSNRRSRSTSGGGEGDGESGRQQSDGNGSASCAAEAAEAVTGDREEMLRAVADRDVAVKLQQAVRRACSS